MFRLLKALPLALILAALSIVTTGCGGGNAQVRVVNAIPEAPDLDIDINGTKYFPSVQTGSVYPTPTTPVTYVSVPAGTDSLEAFDAGTTSSPVIPSQNVTLGSSVQYTVLLGGFLGSAQPFIITDDNNVPIAGDVEVRVIDGSANAGTNGISAAIYPAGTNPPAPQITGLALGSASSYLPLSFETSGYCMEVFNNGNATPLFTFCPPFAQQTGQIVTLVVVDNNNGVGISSQPLVYVDIN
jgi:hypothetical protein